MRTVTLNSPSYPEFDKDGLRSAGHFLVVPRQKLQVIKPKIPLSAGTDSISNAPTPSQNLVADTSPRNRACSRERTLTEEQSRVGRQYQTQQRPGRSLSSVRPTEGRNYRQHVDHSSTSVNAITVRHHSYFFVCYPAS